MSTRGKPNMVLEHVESEVEDDEEENNLNIKSAASEEKKGTTHFGTSKGGSSKYGKLRRHSNFVPAIGPSEKPAELFRKDLISAMKMADTDHLEPEEYCQMTDPWRPEWERGVQVPVGLEEPKKTVFTYIKEKLLDYGTYPFKLPKKLLHAVRDDQFQTSMHELHECHKLAEEMCRYDLDDLDHSWLTELNKERQYMGDVEVPEWQMETVMEALETLCYNNIQLKMKTQEGLGIEYDETVVCDVCQSPESEDTNEMIFCDGCDVCVHQACYGVQHIPTGTWLCRPCSLGVQPSCKLCPNPSGAMKSSKSGLKWAHVSCALWIPEVTFHNPDKLEYIANIKEIPASRWGLTCSLCKDRVGACIQCTVKTCKIAFHVTCAFQHKLDMVTNVLEDTVELKPYCKKHSRRSDGPGSPRKPGLESPKRSGGSSPIKTEQSPGEDEMVEESSEGRSTKYACAIVAEKERLSKIEEEFYECVAPEEIARQLNLDHDLVSFIYSYWVLKRKANFNKPLITPKTEEADLLSRQREDSLLSRMKMFIHLRQDLERVRNLCYMVGRREKLRRQVYNMKEDVFRKQVEYLDKDARNLSRKQLKQLVKESRLQTVVYDRYDAVEDAAARLRQRLTAEAMQEESDFEMTVVIKNSSNQRLDYQLMNSSRVHNVSMELNKSKRKRKKKHEKGRLDAEEETGDASFYSVQGSQTPGHQLDGTHVPSVKLKLSPLGKPAMNNSKTSFQVEVPSSDSQLTDMAQSNAKITKNKKLSFEDALTSGDSILLPKKKKPSKPNWMSGTCGSLVTSTPHITTVTCTESPAVNPLDDVRCPGSMGEKLAHGTENVMRGLSLLKRKRGRPPGKKQICADARASTSSLDALPCGDAPANRSAENALTCGDAPANRPTENSLGSSPLLITMPVKKKRGRPPGARNSNSFTGTPERRLKKRKSVSVSSSLIDSYLTTGSVPDFVQKGKEERLTTAKTLTTHSFIQDVNASEVALDTSTRLATADLSRNQDVKSPLKLKNDSGVDVGNIIKTKRARKNSCNSEEQDAWVEELKIKGIVESPKKTSSRGKSKVNKIEIITQKTNYKFNKKDLIVPQHIRDRVHEHFEKEHAARQDHVCNHRLRISNYFFRKGKVPQSDQSSTDSYMTEDFTPDDTSAAVHRIASKSSFESSHNGNSDEPVVIDDDSEVEAVDHVTVSSPVSNSQSPAEHTGGGRPRRSATSRSWLDFWKDSPFCS